MIESAVIFSTEPDSASAGRDLAHQLSAQLRGGAPDAVVLFASSAHDYAALLGAFTDACHPRYLVGSSSAGEFTDGSRAEGGACALALRSDEMAFAVGLGRGIGADRKAATSAVVSQFRGARESSYPYRAALVLTDALAGHADDLVEQLTLATAGAYQFFGGGAGDDARFQRTHVFCGTDVLSDAVVALEILSHKPLGIGFGHGWKPSSAALRVTAAEGMVVHSLNALPAADVFDAHAEATGQRFDRAAPLPFFLHNILGIDTGAGFRLRVPLAVQPDGSIVCAADVPAGALVHIMQTTSDSAVAAATDATRRALAALGDHVPRAALFFDCVATRLRMGEVFGFELESVSKLLHGAPLVGCNTYGQIARAEGQFNGFHNCTAVVCIVPQ